MKSRTGKRAAANHAMASLSPRETATFIEQWTQVFCKNKQGANTKAYLWHIFSDARYASSVGDVALQRYKEHQAPEYIVFSNDRVTAWLSRDLPEDIDQLDYYVSPRNLAWTMAFTHEDGWLGPYFAEHPDYERLNKKNIERLLDDERKRKEMELARQKGWL
jgi:hypothetical protein